MPGKSSLFKEAIKKKKLYPKEQHEEIKEDNNIEEEKNTNLYLMTTKVKETEGIFCETMI